MGTDRQGRDVVGRFAATPARAPEITLGTQFAPGDRVTYASVLGCRVVDVAGDLLTLRPPHGGRVIAKAAEATLTPETPTQRDENLRVEVAITRLLGSAKSLSRQRREDLDRVGGDDLGAALHAVSEAFASGRAELERYLFVMDSTKRAPVALNHAALAIAVRPVLEAEHYATLTRPARHAGCDLPD